MKWIIVIPARMDSGRFPGKPLATVCGMTLLEHTYSAAKEAGADAVVVTSDSQEVGRFCQDRKITFFPTSGACRNGTERVADVFERFRPDKRPNVVVNWQVDEPFVPPQAAKAAAHDALNCAPGLSTIVAKANSSLMDDRNVVKCIFNTTDPKRWRALWFSRANMAGAEAHVGLYAYRANMLRKIAKLEPSNYARAEDLEQLTWIENDFKMSVAMRLTSMPLAINTPEDMEVWQNDHEAGDE